MNDKSSQGHVSAEVYEGVATIEFYHPSHNSLPSQLLQSLVQAIQHADADENVKIIVLKSAGEKTFCAGASFDELVAIENFPEGKNFFMGFANVINACRKCSKIILGRIQGKAVGGGVGLAAATDYCMATKYASVKLSELAVGIGPFVVGPAIERKMGLSAMSKLALNATEWQTADWAKEKGLFHEVFENTNQLDEYIAYFVKILLNSSTLALGELKKIFWQGTEHWDQLLEERAGISGNLILTDHAKNAIHQFKNKA